MYVQCTIHTVIQTHFASTATVQYIQGYRYVYILGKKPTAQNIIFTIRLNQVCLKQHEKTETTESTIKMS